MPKKTSSKLTQTQTSMRFDMLCLFHFTTQLSIVTNFKARQNAKKSYHPPSLSYTNRPAGFKVYPQLTSRTVSQMSNSAINSLLVQLCAIRWSVGWVSPVNNRCVVA